MEKSSNSSSTRSCCFVFTMIIHDDLSRWSFTMILQRCRLQSSNDDPSRWTFTMILHVSTWIGRPPIQLVFELFQSQCLRDWPDGLTVCYQNFIYSVRFRFKYYKYLQLDYIQFIPIIPVWSGQLHSGLKTWTMCFTWHKRPISYHQCLEKFSFNTLNSLLRFLNFHFIFSIEAF